MKIPMHLSHRPILTVEGYNGLDGPYKNKSDAEGLSVGIAQWNERGRNELSAKVWRHTGGKWSRQSEELPLHRVLDLAALVCGAIHFSADGAVLPIDENFKISTADSDLLSTLGSEIEKNRDALNVSLERLKEALRQLG